MGTLKRTNETIAAPDSAVTPPPLPPDKKSKDA
jgi:hypothetical protein